MSLCPLGSLEKVLKKEKDKRKRKKASTGNFLHISFKPQLNCIRYNRMHSPAGDFTCSAPYYKKAYLKMYIRTYNMRTNICICCLFLISPTSSGARAEYGPKDWDHVKEWGEGGRGSHAPTACSPQLALSFTFRLKTLKSRLDNMSIT